MQSNKMNQHNFKPASKIIGVQFSMLSADEIRKSSVLEVTTSETYKNNKPVIGGLFDPRMGVLEPGLICPTDGHTYIDTPGYFGHIELARPVFFMQHIKEIKKICQMICFRCSHLLIDKEQHSHVINMNSTDRWDYVFKECSKVKRCGNSTNDGCGCKQPNNVKLVDMATLIGEWEAEGVKVFKQLTPEVLLNNFRRIPDDDISFMGFSPLWSRPEWMICQVLPVPPPAVRPSVKHDAQQRSEDDLTHIYTHIIRTNNDLKEKIENNVSPNVIEKEMENLQYFIAMVVNNKIKGADPLAQRSGRPYNCITGRLNSKQGRIRGNLMGKRVDFSARSVITGDPNLSIRQLGVPMKIALNITKPVRVNERNKDFLSKLLENGPDIYPGSRILERRNGEKISLRYVDRRSVRLELGDTLHRHMMDGDAVLFNRQPSLHRMSMMCHIVKVMKKGDTFRMNVGDTAPYNADFDGDEMNMHMPQSILAETELKQLAAIPYQIISPASSSPIIGIFQDSLLGSYRFTRNDIKLTPRDAMNLLMMYPKVNLDKFHDSIEKGKISSFDILSQILAPITLKYNNSLFSECEDKSTSNNVLEIRNGKYIRGQIEKSIFKSGTKGIIHRINNDFGSIPASDFIDDLQNIVTEYMKTSSFSVGISDLIANKKTQTKIMETIRDQKNEVQSLIEKVKLGTFENNTSNSNRMQFETHVNNILNEAINKTGKIGRDSLSKSNRFLMIVNSGSKGTLINISQMISSLGQSSIDGKRVPYGFNNRTLPHYNKFDDTPSARGFVENSYISGLTAPELFFHAMGGRIGLIDTAVKTSQTGYIQRRLIKGLEDLKVEYDMTVRNNKQKIIQFSYGDDGFDSTRIETQNIGLSEMSIEEIYLMYDIVGINDEKGKTINVYSKNAHNRMKRQIEKTKETCRQYTYKMINARKGLIDNVFKNKNETRIKMPIAFSYMITNIQEQLKITGNSTIDITPLEAFQLIESYYNQLNQITFCKPTELFETMYYYHLNPKKLLVQKRFHKAALILLLENIVLRYKQSVVHPGEMVGVIAGQSIGEQTTQLTLNTFHLAGVASKSNVTRGVPRIEEILRLTKNPKNESMTVFLKPNEEADQDKCIHYSKMLDHTKLINVVSSVQICFDPNDDSTKIIEDIPMLKQYYDFEKMVFACSSDEGINNTASETSKSKWIIRMTMDAEQMLDKNITMDDVEYAISESVFGSNVTCIYSDYNDDNLIFRIRMNTIKDKTKGTCIPKSLDQSDEIYMLRSFQDNMLHNIVLRGVPGIQNVQPLKKPNMIVQDDGEYKAKDIWTLSSSGSNLIDTLSLDYIDANRTISDNIRDVHNVLGIEATRQLIHDEIIEVMSASGVSINYHHLSLLCDRMTSNTELVPIFRSGILGDDIGPISKCTFEVQTDVLLQASRHADFDHMRGVSASVMMGKTGSFGTGTSQLILDVDQMSSLDDVISDYRKEEEDIKELFEGLENTTNTCGLNRIEINNNIDSIIRNNTDSNVCNKDDEYDMGF